MKLRHSTWIFFFLGVLAIVLGMIVYAGSVKKLLFSVEHQNANRLLAALVTGVDNEVGERQLAVSAVAASDVLAAALGSAGQEGLDRANRYCDTVARAFRPSVAYLMDASGSVVASSNRDEATSFVGKQYGFRRYFTDAIAGRDSVYLALGVTSGKRGIYFSAPVRQRGGDGTVLGALVVKRSAETLDQEFSKLSQLGEIVFVSEQDVVFASTVAEWLFGTLWETGRSDLEAIEGTRQFGEGPWPWIGLRRDDGGLVSLSGGALYHPHEAPLGSMPQWRIMYLQDLGKTDAMIVSPLMTNAVMSIFPGVIIIGALSVFLFALVQRGITREEALVADLQQAIAEVESLQGILPICSYCKKIRTDEGAWNQIEAYLSERTDVDFSHGICPDCEPRVYREMGLDRED